jgi:hypothetical protein
MGSVMDSEPAGPEVNQTLVPDLDPDLRCLFSELKISLHLLKSFRIFLLKTFSGNKKKIMLGN